MRILHVDPATTWRGGERQVLLQARELAKRGHDCVIAASPESPLATRAVREGLSVTPLAISGDVDVRAILSLARALRSDPPDILHLHTSRAHGAGGIAARLVGFHPVLVTRRLELAPRNRFSRWKYRRLADHYVAISEAVAGALKSAGVAGSRITVIPSGVEMTGAHEALRIDADHRVERTARRSVGTLGAFTAQKDPRTWMDTALRLVKRRPDVDLVWWGEGPFRQSLQEQVGRENLGTRIDLGGFHEELEPFWRRCDVFFLPSKFEALGTVLLDAMARGIPIVASRVGGIPEAVRDGVEGRLVEPGDSVGFANAIEEILKSPPLARALGDAGRERAYAFEMGGVVDRIEELYVTLARQRNSSPGMARS